MFHRAAFHSFEKFTCAGLVLLRIVFQLSQTQF